MPNCPRDQNMKWIISAASSARVGTHHVMSSHICTLWDYCLLVWLKHVFCDIPYFACLTLKLPTYYFWKKCKWRVECSPSKRWKNTQLFLKIIYIYNESTYSCYITMYTNEIIHNCSESMLI